jgi:hypothetical protein
MEIPMIPPGGSTGGGGYRSKWTKTYTNPVGADILGAHKAMNFKPMKAKGKKFRMPRFK